MGDAIILLGIGFLVLIAMVGLIDVGRRLRDGRRLREELSRIEEGAATSEDERDDPDG